METTDSKTIFDSIFSILEQYLEKVSELQLFEKLQLVYTFKETSQLVPEGTFKIISLTEGFANEIKCLAKQLHEIHLQITKTHDWETDDQDIFEVAGNNEDSWDDRDFSTESHALPQYKTRRQRILRETQVKKQELLKLDKKYTSDSLPSKKIGCSQPKKVRLSEWPCKVCLRIFSCKNLLENHSKVVHETDASFEKLDEDCRLDKDSVDVRCCCQCFHTFKNIEVFEKHDCNLKDEEIQELEEPMRSGRDRLICHWDKLKDLNLLVCDQCCEEYRSLKRMVHHLQKCSPGPYPCEICKQSFESKKELNYHKKQNHKDTMSFFCDECDSKYKNRASLQKHMVSKHERTTDAYECDECVEVFTKKILLTRHKEKKHNLIKKFLCQICGEGLSNQQTLQLHVETHSSVKKFHCDFCCAKFHRKDKLIFHRRTHTGEKPFECNQCSKKFIRKAKLTEHLNRHKGLKNHECDLCSKKYSGAYDLRVHKRKTHGVGLTPGQTSKSPAKKGLLIEKPVSEDEDDPGEPMMDEDTEPFIFPTAAEPIAVTDSNPTEALPIGSVDTYLTSAALPPQSVLNDATQNTSNNLTSQTHTAHFYHLPQTVQIQVPVAVTGSSLDLAQLGTQQVILTNFDFNTINNLQF